MINEEETSSSLHFFHEVLHLNSLIIKFLSLVTFSATIVMLKSCASYTDETAIYRNLFSSRNYTAALAELEKSPTLKADKNKLLYLFEKGTLLDKLGGHESSRKTWIEASRKADELYTVSITKEIATYLYNESAQDYPGEDYERVAVHGLMALSFIGTAELDGATIEARKLNNKLKQINTEHGKSPNRYQEDAFARYLSGAIFESKKDWDSAIIDYKTALTTYRTTYNKVFGTPTPDQLEVALARLLKKRKRSDDFDKIDLDQDLAEEKNFDPSKQGEVLVFFESGQIAPKRQKDHLIPIAGQVARFSFPYIFPLSHSADAHISVGIEGKKSVRAELVQNYDQIAAATLEDRMTRVVLKAGARLLIKGQMNSQAKKNFGELGGLAMNVFTAATETADTRSWTTLPAAVYAARLPVTSGKQRLVLENKGKSGELEIEIKPGELKILRAQ